MYDCRSRWGFPRASIKVSHIDNARQRRRMWRSGPAGRRVSRRLEKNRLGFYCEKLIDTLKLLEPCNSQWFTSVEATSAAKLVRRVWLFVNLSWLISPLRKLLSQRSPPPSPPLSPCLSQPQFNQALSLYLWMLPNIIISNQMQLGPTKFAGTLKGTLQTGTTTACAHLGLPDHLFAIAHRSARSCQSHPLLLQWTYVSFCPRVGLSWLLHPPLRAVCTKCCTSSCWLLIS